MPWQAHSWSVDRIRTRPIVPCISGRNARFLSNQPTRRWVADEHRTSTVQLFVLAPFKCHDADIKFGRVLRSRVSNNSSIVRSFRRIWLCMVIALQKLSNVVDCWISCINRQWSIATVVRFNGADLTSKYRMLKVDTRVRFPIETLASGDASLPDYAFVNTK